MKALVFHKFRNICIKTILWNMNTNCFTIFVHRTFRWKSHSACKYHTVLSHGRVIEGFKRPNNWKSNEPNWKLLQCLLLLLCAKRCWLLRNILSTECWKISVDTLVQYAVLLRCYYCRNTWSHFVQEKGDEKESKEASGEEDKEKSKGNTYNKSIKCFLFTSQTFAEFYSYF